MNTIDFTLQNGFKFHQGTLEFLQNSIMLSAQAAASYAGGLAILSGCTVNGSNVDAGMVVINGEVLPFEAGTLDDKVIIQETIVDLPYEDGTLQPAQKIRIAKFGDDGVTDYQWSDFKRNTSEGILARLERLERVAAPFTNANKGGMVLWNRPANTIPAGWQEVVDWRGRLPMGYDPAQTEFNEVGKTGGSKERTLTISNLPAHDHVTHGKGGIETAGLGTRYLGRGNSRYSGSGADGFGTGSSSSPDSGMKTGDTGSGNSFSLLNPYRIVVFIEYVGG